MTTQLSLPTGSWVSDDKRASGRRLVNCFSEIGPQTGSQDLKTTIPPAYLRRMFGISSYASVVSSPIVALTSANSATGSFLGWANGSDPNCSGQIFGSLAPIPFSLGGLDLVSIYTGPGVTTGWGYLYFALSGNNPSAFSFTLVDYRNYTYTVSWDGSSTLTVTGGPGVIGTTGFAYNSSSNTFLFTAGWNDGEYFLPPSIPAIGNPYTITAVTGGAAGTNTNPVRGIRSMGGITYVVIGASLYTLTNNGNATNPSTSATLTQIATGIEGSSFVRLCDNTECLFILVPGTNIGYTYTVANGLAQCLDETFLFYGAKDVWFIDSYMVFLALNGLEFYNDDGQSVSGTGPITFTTGGVFPREFGTDQFVGMCVDHRTIHMFGQLTTEAYVDAGNATESPFASAPDGFMQIGCNVHCGYTVALQDQSVFWVANDLTVRRLNGQTPVRVSNSGIEALLENNKFNLYGAYALTPTIGGHPLWVLTIPLAGRTVVYDCLTTEWFDLSSNYNDIEYWRPLCWYNAQGFQLVGDSQFSQIGYLDAETFTEWGNPMVVQIYTQSVYDNHNRITHERIEAVVTVGQGPTTQNSTVLPGSNI